MAPNMRQSRDGVRKPTGFYHRSVQKLETVLEERLRQLANLEQQRTLQAAREQVLVDLVLQQEHHLEHLNKLKAAVKEDMDTLNDLFNMCENPAPTSEHSAPDVMCNSTWARTSAASHAPPTADTAVNGVSCNASIKSDLVQLFQQPLLQLQVQEAFLQSQPQQQGRSPQNSISEGNPLLKVHAQEQQLLHQQQQSLLRTPSQCSSDTAGSFIASSGGSVLSNSCRPQYTQSLMDAASNYDWDRAMMMTSDDWCDYYVNLATRLKEVMRLRQLKRDAASSAEAAQGQQHAEQLGMQMQQIDSHFAGVSPAERAAIVAMSFQPGGPPAGFVDPDTEMIALVDDLHTLCNLCVLHNPIPVRDCARRNTVTKELHDLVPLSFWAEATAKTGFSEEQMQHLRFGYSEYWRILGQVHSKQQQLASSVECSTAASAPTPWGMREGTSTAATAAAVTAPAQQRDDLVQLLNEHMARWQTAAQLLLQFYCNTMTHEQSARMLVACYPFFPRMGGLIGALAEADEPGAFDRLESHMQALRAQHAQAINRRKLQLEKQRQEYWRRLVVLREQQLQQAQLQPKFVLQPL